MATTKLQLNVNELKVESFRTIDRDAEPAKACSYFPPAHSTAPCLNSEETCDPRCIA